VTEPTQEALDLVDRVENMLLEYGPCSAALIIQAALDKAREDEPQWKPIETAPKDGTWFMGWYAGLDDPEPFCWVSDDDEYAPYVGWAEASRTWGGTLYDGYNEAPFPPTHWAPLPPKEPKQ